jgi:hypothetical protein
MCILKKWNSSTKSIAYMTLLHPILEYGAACLDPYRKGQIHALDRVQKKAAKFAFRMNESNWETLSHCRKISRICALFKVYCEERVWKAGDRIQRSNYLSRIDHEQKIRNRRQRTDIRKYSFVNRTIRLRNRLPAEMLGTVPSTPNAFRKRVRRVINVVNWRKCEWVVNYLKCAVQWSEVKCSAVKGGKLGHTVKGVYGWWSAVKVLLKLVCYTCGVTILETRYSTFSPLCCFSCVHCC